MIFRENCFTSPKNVFSLDLTMHKIQWSEEINDGRPSLFL